MGINDLNDDCLINIFSFLSIIDRFRIARVCTRWNTISPLTWQTVKAINLQEEFWGLTSKSKIIIDKTTFNRVLERCGNFVTHVDVTKEILGRIHKIRVESCKAVFKIIADTCPKLRSLTVGRPISESAVEFIAYNFDKLEKVCIQIPNHDYTNSVSELFLNHKTLTSVKVIDSKISRNCLLDLNFDNLQELHFSNCLFETTESMVNVIYKSKGLHTLSIDFCYSKTEWERDALIAVGSLKGLRRLKLKISNFQYVAIDTDFIKALSNLEELRLGGNAVSCDEVFSVISRKCRKIKKLKIYNSECMTDEAISHIANLPYLEYLGLNSLFTLTGENLGELSQIKYLKCIGCPQLKNEGLANLIANSKSINTIEISECADINQELIANVSWVASARLSLLCDNSKISNTLANDVHSLAKVENEIIKKFEKLCFYCYKEPRKNCTDCYHKVEVSEVN